MAINLDLTRPKQETSSDITFTISNGTAVETDTPTEESVFIPFNLASTNPASATIANVTTVSASASITAANGALSVLKPGDVLSGTGIDTGAVVVSVATDGNSAVMDLAATASGTITLTYDPPAGTPTVFGIKLQYLGAGNSITVKPYLMVYDGSLPPGTAGTADNATNSYELKRADGKAITIDADAFLSSFRVARPT